MLEDRPIGAALSRDIGRGEAVEAELDRLVERRSRQKDPDEEHELWRESVGVYTARRREELRAAWCEYHRGRAASIRRNLEALAECHEAAASKLMDVAEQRRKDY